MVSIRIIVSTLEIVQLDFEIISLGSTYSCFKTPFYHRIYISNLNWFRNECSHPAGRADGLRELIATSGVTRGGSALEACVCWGRRGICLFRFPCSGARPLPGKSGQGMESLRQGASSVLFSFYKTNEKRIIQTANNSPKKDFEKDSASRKNDGIKQREDRKKQISSHHS